MIHPRRNDDVSHILVVVVIYSPRALACNALFRNYLMKTIGAHEIVPVYRDVNSYA